MLVLAIDTSTDMLACAVAEWEPTGSSARVDVLASGDHLCRRRANVELATTCLDVLSRAGHTMSDLEAVLVGRGPGSFTGVRIGIATARALALATGCSLVGLTALEALAAEVRAPCADARDGRDLGVAVDAGREMVFWARFAAGLAASSPPELLSLGEAAARLGDVPMLLAGSAAAAVHALAPRAGACEIISGDVQPDAASFARPGALRTPVDVLRPLYLRPPDAKAQTSMVLPRAQP